MTGFVRNAVVTAACMLVASAAFAGVPSPLTSTIGGGTATERINLVGYSGSAVDPLNAADSVSIKAKLSITVRDLALNPVAGSNVVLDFSGVLSDVKIGSVQKYHAETVGCAGATVSNFSNAAGVVTFTVIGGRSAATPHTTNKVKVYADGVLLGSISCGTFDENNSGGLSGADLALVASDYFSASNPDRSDFNGDLSVTGADLAYEASAYFSARQNTSSATLCP